MKSMMNCCGRNGKGVTLSIESGADRDDLMKIEQR